MVKKSSREKVKGIDWYAAWSEYYHDNIPVRTLILKYDVAAKTMYTTWREFNNGEGLPTKKQEKSTLGGLATAELEPDKVVRAKIHKIVNSCWSEGIKAGTIKDEDHNYWYVPHKVKRRKANKLGKLGCGCDIIRKGDKVCLDPKKRQK
jgi:hypothetical protein